jgi:dTDP-4-amino-4,6-dideoxygalactose transaminase
MFEPITVSLSPNVLSQDVKKAIKVLFSPNKWVKGNKIRLLEKEFARLFPGFKAISFVSGRTALLAILKSLGISQGDEVLVQSFTCVVVANAVIELGAKPVFVDIEKETFNINLEDLRKKITPKARTIIVQHTFGYPVKMKEILALAQKHKLKVIEDCAHGIGISYQGKKLGMFGEAAFFSFGRDKGISSVFGGMAISKDKKVTQKLKDYQKKLSYPSASWVVQQLLHPIIFSLILPVYNFFSLGKFILVFSQKLKLLSWPVGRQEKKGVFPKILLAKMPNGLACLAHFQLKKLSDFNESRARWVKFYASRLKNLPVKIPDYKIKSRVFPLLRFTIRTEESQSLYEFAKKKGVILNNWYCPAVSPAGSNYQAVNYDPSLCPIAERVSLEVVNLPTHPRVTLEKAKKIVKVVREFFHDQDKNN